MVIIFQNLKSLTLNMSKHFLTFEDALISTSPIENGQKVIYDRADTVYM